MEPKKNCEFNKEAFIELLKREGFGFLEPKIKYGVYVIFNDREIKYIGQSGDLQNRLKEHRRNHILSDGDSVYVKKIFSKDKRIDAENYYLSKFLPSINLTTRAIINERKYLFEEYLKFRDWLDQFPISKRTYELYCKVIEKFINQMNIGLKKWRPHYDLYIEANKFLKNNQRYYYYNALAYYFKFKSLDIDRLVKIKENKRILKNIPDIDKLEYLLLKIKRKISEEAYWIMKLLILTGARINEILKLRLKDIGDDYVLFKISKTNEERIVYLEPSVLAELKIYLTKEKGLLSEDKCFYTECKSEDVAYRMFRKEISNKLSNILTKEEQELLKKTHNFRRAVINYILQKTGDIVKAQSFVGHSDIKTTERYLANWLKEKALKEVCEIMKKRALVTKGFEILKNEYGRRKGN